MRPVTDSIPKPLISVCSKPILDHIVEALPSAIDQLIIVVGYKGEQIKEHCGEVFHGRPVVYVEQENHAGGTGDALMCAKHLAQGTFLFMHADDIHGKQALEEVVKHEHAMLAIHSDTPELFGVVTQNDDGTLQEIVEKPEHPSTNFVNIGGYVINDSVFSYDVSDSDSGELYATDIITAYAQKNPVHIVTQKRWLPIGTPENITQAEAILCPNFIDSIDQI
ncbi:MAG: NDP-sugar pyrophosphorylase family protein [Candidatus Azotimanducaceae bacterium]|jgi:NDP-sugar pyrophosphorylase family protein